MDVRNELYHPHGLFDVLEIPLLGKMLRWRYGRLLLQIPFLLIAILLMYDGFTGPQRASENLATVVPWVHYRGIIVLVLLLTGNLFCMGCPFTIPRTLAKRLSKRGRRFPRFLRNKWLAFLSTFMMFFLYEYLDLWSSPALTAWLIVTYFVMSFVLEALYAESPFCKYVCPLGTFNYVYSTPSPLQIATKNYDICRTCVGKECVNGSYAEQTLIRVDEIPTADGGTIQRTVEHGPKGTLGCGTELFVPSIKSNLDCMMCLDCVRACPHDNVALMARTPGRELLRAGSWPKRWDVSLMVIGMAFFGLINAFGMVPPVYTLMQNIADALGLTNSSLPDRTIEFIVLLIIFVFGVVIIPVAATLITAAITHALTSSQHKYNLRQIVAGFAPAFVPIGLGIWTAHYLFHFLTGVLTLIPVIQAFLIDHYITLLGSQPNWALGGMDVSTVQVIQVIALTGGFLGSMIVAQRTAMRMYRRQAMTALMPWALYLLILMYFAVQVFSLPMEMRGTILFS